MPLPLCAKVELPVKRSEGYFRFLCPLCGDFNTATNSRTNLARCFRCEKNFNPIEASDLLLMVPLRLEQKAASVA